MGLLLQTIVIGAVASWLVRSTPERAVRFRALAGDIMLFLGKTLYSHVAFLHPGEYMGKRQIFCRTQFIELQKLRLL